jgi:hypothetical protein
MPLSSTMERHWAARGRRWACRPTIGPATDRPVEFGHCRISRQRSSSFRIFKATPSPVPRLLGSPTRSPGGRAFFSPTPHRPAHHGPPQARAEGTEEIATGYNTGAPLRQRKRLVIKTPRRAPVPFRPPLSWAHARARPAGAVLGDLLKGRARHGRGSSSRGSRIGGSRSRPTEQCSQQAANVTRQLQGDRSRSPP